MAFGLGGDSIPVAEGVSVGLEWKGQMYTITKQTMNVSEQTMQQIERALRKAASKFSADAECYPLTDLLVQVKQESGELLIFDDDDHELTRCVISEWIGNKDENFYAEIQPVIRQAIVQIKDVTENVAVLKPYSYVLTGEDGEAVADLYLVDDDTIIVSGDLMKGLGEDLDRFWEELSKEA